MKNTNSPLPNVLLRTESRDSDADGKPEEIYTSTYDDSGNLLRTSRKREGKPDRLQSNTYDDNGNLTSELFDRKTDGKIERINTYTYDDNGSLIEKTYDNDADGNAERIDTYAYDDSGNLIKKSYDRNADGNVDRVYIYAYDSNGNQLSESYDANGNGDVDRITTFAYDSNGILISKSYDDNADGKSDGRDTYSYDSSGNLISKSYDEDEDSTPDSIYAYTYDAQGNLLSESYDDDANGVPEYIDTYTYDAKGNLLSESYDDDGDGKPDGITTYTYEYADRLSPTMDDQLLTIDSLSSTGSAIRFQPLQLNVDSLSELRIFSTDASGGNALQIASFSIYPKGQQPLGYVAPATTLSGADIKVGTTLRFELVQDGTVQVATVSRQPDSGQILLDFGGETQFTAMVASQDASTNLLTGGATGLDMSALSGPVDVMFSVYREAAYDGMVKFYKTVDAEGRVADPVSGELLLPGEDGYKEAALAQQLDVELTTDNGQVSTFSAVLTGGEFVSMFLIADGTDATASDVYFAHAGINSNNNDHVKQLGNNTFGFEDMSGLGDKDYNDVVVKVDVV